MFLQMEKMRTVSEDLHSRVPDSMVEKASSMASLQSLLEYHDSFSREVERESSALTLLRHHVLSLFLHPHPTPNQHDQETPCLQEIQSIQEKYDKYVVIVIVTSTQPVIHLSISQQVHLFCRNVQTPDTYIQIF